MKAFNATKVAQNSITAQLIFAGKIAQDTIDITTSYQNRIELRSYRVYLCLISFYTISEGKLLLYFLRMRWGANNKDIVRKKSAQGGINRIFDTLSKQQYQANRENTNKQRGQSCRCT